MRTLAPFPPAGHSYARRLLRELDDAPYSLTVADLDVLLDFAAREVNRLEAELEAADDRATRIADLRRAARRG